MNLLDAIQIARADEQLEAGAWKRRDKDEARMPKPPPSCAVCGVEIPGGCNRKVCEGCKAAGFVGVPCKACRGPITRTDQVHADPHKRGFCKQCRPSTGRPPGRPRRQEAA
jgi:hypothetical protein